MITTLESQQNEALQYLDSIWWNTAKFKNIPTSKLAEFITANKEILFSSKDITSVGMQLFSLREKMITQRGFLPLVKDISEIIDHLLFNSQNSEDKPMTLRYAGCKTSSDAVNYAIDHKLIKINFDEFPDLTDNDLIRLIDHNPNIEALYICGGTITDLSGKKIESLKELKVLQLWRTEHVRRLDLSNCPKLKIAFFGVTSFETIIFPAECQHIQLLKFDQCRQLTQLTLPSIAPKLTFILCLICSKLQSLTLPKYAPYLETIDLFDNDFKELSLPEEIPSLKNLKCYGICEIKELIFPKKAPALNNFSFISGMNLTRLTLPKEAPLLNRVCLFDCKNLSELHLVEKETPYLQELTISYCPCLKIDDT